MSEEYISYLFRKGYKITYDGESIIHGLPTRKDLVKQSDTSNLVLTLEKHISEGKIIFFHPNDVIEENEYVYGNPEYKLHLIGITQDGTKTHVILDGIEIYLDIRIPNSSISDRSEKVRFRSRLEQALNGNDIKFQKIKDYDAYPIKGYNRNKIPWKRIFFYNIQERKKAISLLRNHPYNYETASDDISSYYRMAARVNGTVLAGWGLLKNYQYQKLDSDHLCEHEFRLHVKNFTPLINPMDTKEEQEKKEDIKRKMKIARDKLLVMTWDIETISTSNTGEVPMAENETDHVFMIAATFHWKDDPDALYKVCIVDIESKSDKDWITIKCGTEKNIIKAFAVMFKHFAPDIIADFNGGNYDWPFILEKARQFKLLGYMFDTMTALPRGKRATTEENVEKWNINKDKQIKIGPTSNAFVTFMKIPGCIYIDVRIMFQQLFPKAEVGKGSSLNFYLEACNLSSKADMPYKRMWQIREEEDTENMRDVAHYCVVDAKRCQELLVKRNVINNRREVAVLSYVSLFDSIFYAGGHKVCNMLIAHAIRRDILCSNINNQNVEQGKYPGAWVFHPKKGLTPDPTDKNTLALEKARSNYLENKNEATKQDVTEALECYNPRRPTTGLDFSSLYPSIIMTYNLSPEKFIEDPEEAQKLKEEGNDLHYTEFNYNNRTVTGWFVRHNGEKEQYGLFPSILIDLFNRRSAMKNKLVIHEKIIEHMEVIMGKIEKSGDDADFLEIFNSEFELQKEKLIQLNDQLDKKRNSSLNRQTKKDIQRIEKEINSTERNIKYMKDINSKESFLSQYKETSFDFMTIDSKQKALKVFMNTFYGEAGNKRSSFFLLQLAGGVTTAGQYNIKMVADYVTSKGFDIRYGDTDSVYVSPPNEYFKNSDRKYALGEIDKEEYWTEMTHITMDSLDTLKNQVNDFLKEDNGTGHLKMAYEEVLFPVVFTGKKKYFGIAHINVPNFHPKKMFIKGIDVVKRGQTELAKKIGFRIMWTAVSLENNNNLQSIVENVIREAIENREQWSFEDFIQSDAWKPAKDNKSVQRFIARMRARIIQENTKNDRRESRGLERLKSNYYIPDPGERFHYVLVKSADMFDIKGLKSKQKKGDIMEYADVARELNLPIDIGKYLTSYVVGLCARFINYSDQFTPKNIIDEKIIDEKSRDAAKKYLTNFIATLQNEDPEVVRKRGYAYKRAWKKASAECTNQLQEQVGLPAADVLHGKNLSWSDFLPSEEENTVNKLAEHAKNAAKKSFDLYSEKYLKEYCKSVGIDISCKGDSSRLYEVYKIIKCQHSSKSKNLRISNITLSYLDRSEATIRKQLADIIPKLTDIATLYESVITEMVNNWRSEEHKLNPEDLGMYNNSNEVTENGEQIISIKEDDLSIIKDLRDLWYKLVGIYRIRIQRHAIIEYLEGLKNRIQKCVSEPDKELRDEKIKHFIDKKILSAEDLSIGNGGY